MAIRELDLEIAAAYPRSRASSSLHCLQGGGNAGASPLSSDEFGRYTWRRRAKNLLHADVTFESAAEPVPD
jgi:hypothetical protein